MIQVGNYIHNMATFFSGLVIGLINCWQIALITLATGPFIVAAGGISNIFLHRLAENIQDAYAEAASMAEQVICCLSFKSVIHASKYFPFLFDSFTLEITHILRSNISD
jgi:ABC-type bacteriocin/lantibiotic exporter with double-glycine peptidase domain